MFGGQCYVDAADARSFLPLSIRPHISTYYQPAMFAFQSPKSLKPIHFSPTKELRISNIAPSRHFPPPKGCAGIAGKHGLPETPRNGKRRESRECLKSPM